MIGRRVYHRTFGVGCIVEHKDGRIAVDFSGTIRPFQYPESFERFLETDDPVLKQMATDAIRYKSEARKQAEEERQKAKEAALKATQAIRSFPYPTEPLSFPSKRLAHGSLESIAFKCNYCDGGSSGTSIGFRGKCSDWMIRYNIEQAKHVWCSIGSACKQYHDGNISRAELDAYRSPEGLYEACYESGFFDRWTMGAGVHHTGPDAGKPMHINRIHHGSLAVMTTRKPSDRESDRFIFAAFLVSSSYSGDDQEEGNVTADPVWRIELEPGQAERILFWNYYFNARKPEKIAFGSGLHRYLTDIEACQILRDIAIVKDDDLSKAFFRHFCELNHIDSDKLESPSGALLRQKQDNE